MMEYFQRLLGGAGLAPHGFCLLWDPVLIWTHVVADALIGLAYFSIPVAMAVFLTRRADMQYRGVAWLFVAFILACGTTHFLSIWTLWVPDYGIEALVKLVTALVSVATAIALWPLIPRALALPSPAALRRANADLEALIAERDLALAALERANTERHAAEAMLHQSQKMEALGQLTGGIAHDFNNLLTIVMANVSRARRLSSDGAIETSLDSALLGAEQAARLTDQLLSFARRQPLRAQVQDLNGIIGRIAELSSSGIDTRVDIQMALAPDLWPVEVDAGQAENAILNLIVNARDAMPDGGTLVLATANVPGLPDMVSLTVRDTGHGMDDDVRERALEPFYTTKEMGRGSGLGLPQVYGFATQSGGSVTIDSAPGAGTMVRLLLRRAPRAAGVTGRPDA